MILAALGALIFANSPWNAYYHAFIAYPLSAHIDVSLFTTDVLMAVFFFLVGMELKHEMLEGALAAPGQKTLPLFAALGGVIAPALIYLIVTHAHPEYRAGWAIPTATDIAFAVCVLRLLGPAAPHSAKMFLLAIAIYDDLAAILIIAFFYSVGLAMLPLAAAAGIATGLWLLNRCGFTHLIPYLALGAALWFAIHAAGIHPTVAGVITGLAIPLHRRDGAPILGRLLKMLHPYVAFGILPLFAFTRAGLDVRGLNMETLLGALPLAVSTALVLGKQIGIFAASWACVRLTRTPLPDGMGWRMVYGVAAMAGIGFTMSLFLGQLAFPGPGLQPAVTLGVLGGSLISALCGVFLLRRRPAR